ncbi:secondary thiamine-phosphate synthase enzyme [Methylohalomonas lacus]|uniref:Secondary thiamine-phosphate synthase enzyme n=1 Tax=Methylohalomonas lacus TaxID=398773 RepID=A0AAE3L5I3_9GAMM|nr:secondary thiamine-phosphate synthase enzyme YjbQ [Methylohalomonas lacus]MCS3903357.1 secondary thiamine-phosphate synthase enzyme [Methylohalomonas lacus]
MLVQETLEFDTPGRGSTDITRRVTEVVRAAGMTTGLCNVFLQHTSASLMLCENADPDVRRDLEAFMQRLVPDGDPLFVHTTEGPDDMPAHVRSILTGNSLNVPISDGRLALGTWQGIYLWEHRTSRQARRVTLTIHGE